MSFRSQLAAWQSSLAEAHTQDLRWYAYDRVLEMALGRASKVVTPRFNQQLAMYQESLSACNAIDIGWAERDEFLDNKVRVMERYEWSMQVQRQSWRLAIRVDCPVCLVKANEFCINRSTGALRGQANFFPHYERKKLAKKNRFAIWDETPRWEEPNEPSEPDEEPEEEILVVGSPEEREFANRLQAKRQERKAKWEAIERARKRS